MDAASPYAILFHSLTLIPIYHYIVLCWLLVLAFLYNFLEIHFFSDLSCLFRGRSVTLTYHHSSELYQFVVSRCKVLHGRFQPTPWLASPHLQTVFLSIFGKSPDVKYTRNLFPCSDGGTIALDWLMACNGTGAKDKKSPVMIVIPGLTSDSSSPYVKHFAFEIAKGGWNVVVSNHRGLGGISITSDRFYNAGWTEDVRNVIEYIRNQYPECHIYAVGTSIGANVLVKYLGEEGPRTPLVGAAAICSPWDLVICDRFINRRLAQRFYDRALAIGLQGYAKLHQSVLARLIDWNGIEMSRSVRDFDNYATRVLGKFETVDTYYRRASCVDSLTNVKVPLLCISSLDDPVCTREAIPLDECRANINVVLATTPQGGHLAYYEGFKASSLWWVRATAEFFHALHSSPLATIKNHPKAEESEEIQLEASSVENLNSTARIEDDDEEEQKGKCFVEQRPDGKFISLLNPIRKRVDELARYRRVSVWLLTYLAITTTWPLLGSALRFLLTRKRKK